MKYPASLANLSHRLRSASEHQPPIGGVIKRGFDIVSAATGILLLSPLLFMLAMLVKFSDGGRVFYGHSRIGRNGDVFQCFKFRTMVENGDEVLAAHFARHPQSREDWLATHVRTAGGKTVLDVGGKKRTLPRADLPELARAF